MIVTFCGHSHLPTSVDEENFSENVYNILEQEIHGMQVDFYLGGYGHFDGIALRCCKRYQSTHPNARLYFITPYLDDEYLKNRQCLIDFCDGSIYPEIERIPRRFAISARNKWMVKQADLVIAYVICYCGGAAKTLEYAHKTKKRYINIGNYEF